MASGDLAEKERLSPVPGLSSRLLPSPTGSDFADEVKAFGRTVGLPELEEPEEVEEVVTVAVTAVVTAVTLVTVDPGADVVTTVPEVDGVPADDVDAGAGLKIIFSRP